MCEVWKEIDGYNYSVSNLGRVKNNKSDYILKNCIGRKRRTFKIHKLVAIAFLNHIPCGFKLVVNHKDGNKLNNRPENLEIVTQRENASICYRSNNDSFTSQYVGVSYSKEKKKWIGRIKIYNKAYHLGYFLTEIDCKNIYDDALLNFKNDNFENWYLTNIKKKNSSKYKGVSYYKYTDKWVSIYKGKRLGTFKTELEAYEAYQNKT